VSADAPAPAPDGAAGSPPGYDRNRPKQTRIVSAQISLPTRFREIWRSRELLLNLISTEIKVKYKNSALGLLWSMVAPAVTLGIYWFVFGVVLKNSIPNFVIYLFSGLLFWNFFQTGLLTATGVVVQRAGIVKKVAFPREILALASIGTAGVYMFFQTIVLVIFMVALGTAPDWPLLPLLAVAFLAEILIASALGIALSAINVRLRDMQHLIEVVLTAWFWACPVVYSFWNSIQSHLGPHGLTWIYLLNPMTPIILTSQRVIYAHPVVTLTSGGKPVEILPPWPSSTYLLMDLALVGIGVALLLLALSIFGRLEGNFAEEL